MDIRFGEYLLRRQERQVIARSGALDLSARCFDILQLLLEHPEQLVDKNTIMDAVWPGVVVEENTLQVHISALRKALGSASIVTVHGRGYKYAGPRPGAVAGDLAAKPNKDKASSRKPVLVVLPLENMSGDVGQQFLSDGITEDITDRLTRFRTLAVIGQHSAFAFRGSAPDFEAIRTKLKADFVVTGSLRRAGDRIRIAIRLSDARSETAIWAEHYDRPLGEISMLQDEMTGLIAATISKQLEIEIAARSGGGNPASFECYEHILRGHWHFKKLTVAANAEAQASYERALAIEPRNAEALAHHAMCLTSGWLYAFSLPDVERGVEEAREAADIDPQNALCHAVLGFGLLWASGLEAARQPMDRAIAINPDGWFGLTNRSMVSVYEGNGAEARHYLNRARRLNPLPPLWLAEFESVAGFAEERYAEVLPGVEAVPDGAWDMMYALAAYGHLGLREKARSCLARFRQQGRMPDFAMGIAREPYVDPTIRDRLSEGLRKAISF